VRGRHRHPAELGGVFLRAVVPARPIIFGSCRHDMDVMCNTHVAVVNHCFPSPFFLNLQMLVGGPEPIVPKKLLRRRRAGQFTLY